MKTREETSVLKLMELLAIKDTLLFMNAQKQFFHSEIPSCICLKDMEAYEFDEAALKRLEAKLCHKEGEMSDEETI